jgi:hypothetical protein
MNTNNIIYPPSQKTLGISPREVHDKSSDNPSEDVKSTFIPPTTFDDQKELKNDFPQELMVNKVENLNTLLNSQIYELIEKYSTDLINRKKSFTPIHVDEIASRLAQFYETVRKIIDWKDDSVLRRGAIERILKRILFPKMAGITDQQIETYTLSETVTTELIRGGHLPNDSIPTERMKTVADSLKKYLYFMEYSTKYKPLEVKKRVNFTTFVLEVASCEIEEILTNPIKEYEIIRAMSDLLMERINILPKDKISDEVRKRYIFIAVCRTLYDLDDSFITYRLLNDKYINWHNPDDDEIKQIAIKLPEMWKTIQEELDLPEAKKFSSLAERIDTVFMLLDDVLEKLKDQPKNILKTIENKNQFKKLIANAYAKRYKTLKRRLFRLAIFSTLSVFLSNWLTFYIIEVPLAKLFYENWSLSAAVMDFLIPTILMFFLVIIIKPPKEDNIKKVINVVMGFVYNDEGWEYYQIRLKNANPSIFQVSISALYIYTMFLVFAGIGYIFYIAHLPITSVLFDTFTIALTVFAAMTIKNKARELNVDEHSSVSDFILDIISVPIAKVGSIFAAKWKEYNVIAIFFNFIIETPFALVLNFIQGWSEFIKERRSELH